jgi:hypothetical protein
VTNNIYVSDIPELLLDWDYDLNTVNPASDFRGGKQCLC